MRPYNYFPNWTKLTLFFRANPKTKTNLFNRPTSLGLLLATVKAKANANLCTNRTIIYRIRKMTIKFVLSWVSSLSQLSLLARIFFSLYLIVLCLPSNSLLNNEMLRLLHSVPCLQRALLILRVRAL